MRIGIFGGTFDPPHMGHLILAAEALDQLKLDRLLWVLTPEPPHKVRRYVSSLEQRLALVQAAVSPDPSFELSRIDIDRPPPHYSVGTVEQVQAQYPQAEVVFLMGGDSLRDLPTWHAPQLLVEKVAAFGVMRRPGDSVDLRGLEEQLPGVSEKIWFVDAPLLEISSTEIRERVAEGRSFRYYLPPAVYQLIVEEGYYRSTER